MKKYRGFTIIELLVIIAIVGLISSVALANLSQARENARRATSLQQEASIYRAIGDRIIGDWDFNEGSGSTAFDKSGNGRDGTIVNASFVAPGADGTGYALYFSGNNSHVKGFGISSTSNTNLTVTSWVNPEAITNDRTIISSGYQGCLNYGVGIKSGGPASQTANYAQAIPLEEETGPSLIRNNTWTFLVTTFDSSGIATTYINGSPVGTFSNLATTNPCNSTTWTIGATGLNETVTSSTYNFAGLIDNVKVYTEVFTASEVQRLYALELQQIKLADK